MGGRREEGRDVVSASVNYRVRECPWKIYDKRVDDWTLIDGKSLVRVDETSESENLGAI